jgi:glycine cleavage system aminomethyltransferase T
MTIPEGLRATPFSPRYADTVTEWIDVYTYAVPLFITDPAKEYHAIRTTAGISEYSMLYKWHVEGPACLSTVDRVFSRDVTGQAAGTIAYGVVTDSGGFMIDDVTVSVVSSETVQVVGGNPVTGRLHWTLAGLDRCLGSRDQLRSRVRKPRVAHLDPDEGAHGRSCLARLSRDGDLTAHPATISTLLFRILSGPGCRCTGPVPPSGLVRFHL